MTRSLINAVTGKVAMHDIAQSGSTGKRGEITKRLYMMKFYTQRFIEDNRPTSF